MNSALPEPLSLPWELKPLSSARSGLKTLADGRRCFWIDEFLKGVTPKMLVWWVSHLEGDLRSGAAFSAGTAFSIPSITAGRVTFGAYRTGQLVRERRFEFANSSPETRATRLKLPRELRNSTKMASY
jgi:hypothetical protein